MDSPTHDQVMIAPAMIGSGPAGLKRAPEIGKREGGYLLVEAQLDGGRIERVHRLADLLEVILLLPGLPAMRIKCAKAAEEHLPADAQLRVETDQPRDFF